MLRGTIDTLGFEADLELSLVIAKFLWLVIGLFFFYLNAALSVLVVIVSVLLLNDKTIYWQATM